MCYFLFSYYPSSPLSLYFYTIFISRLPPIFSSPGSVNVCMRARCPRSERLLILAPFPRRDCNLRFRYARRLGHPRGGTLPANLPPAYVPNEIHLYSISNRAFFPTATDRYTIARFVVGFNLFVKIKNYFYFCPHDLSIFIYVTSLNFFHAAFFMYVNFIEFSFLLW